MQSSPAQPAGTPESPAAATPAPTAAAVPTPVAPANDDAPASPQATTPATPPSPGDQPSLENEIIVTGRAPSPVDPVEKLNIVSYQAVQAVDKAVVAPITHAYEHGIPEPVRDGLHNVLDNLDEPVVFLNFMLQLKPGKAFETLGRMVINTTLGVGGLFDVAKKKPFNLPRRPNGLADTLGYYGVGTGPYLFLPLIGPTTLRDLLARPFDLLVLPVIAPVPFGDPKVAFAKGVLNSLDERLQSDALLKKVHTSDDPYVTQREEYLARRKAEIDVLKGKRKSIYDPPYYQFSKPASQAKGDAKSNTQEEPAPVSPTTPAPETTPAVPKANTAQP